MSKVTDELKESNLYFQAGQIKNHLGAWKTITSDKWVLDTVLGANIELEDISDLLVHVNSKQSRKNIVQNRDSSTSRQRCYIKPIKNLEGEFISSIFSQREKG